MSSKPSLVFIPGAWHSPEYWGKLVSAMEARDFKCTAVALPTALSDPAAGFSDDVRVIRNSITAEATNGRNVVVIVHSYGGAVGASAIKGLTKPQGGELSSKSGSVIGLFMISTGFAITGSTFLDGFGGSPPPIWNLNPDTGFTELTVDPRELFYHDLTEEEGKYWVGRLQKLSNKALNTGADVSYSGWKDVPCWYLATTEDKALPIEAQKFFIETAKKDGGDVTLREVASSHSPMLSQPEKTVEALLEALAAFTKSQ